MTKGEMQVRGKTLAWTCCWMICSRREVSNLMWWPESRLRRDSSNDYRASAWREFVGMKKGFPVPDSQRISCPFPKLWHSQSVSLWRSILQASLWESSPPKSSAQKLTWACNVKCFCTIIYKSNNTVHIFLLLNFLVQFYVVLYNPIYPFCWWLYLDYFQLFCSRILIRLSSFSYVHGPSVFLLWSICCSLLPIFFCWLVDFTYFRF